MKGVKSTRKDKMYLLEFDSYANLLEYLTVKRPSQIAISFDEEDGLTASVPVNAKRVRASYDKTPKQA